MAGITGAATSFSGCQSIDGGRHSTASTQPTPDAQTTTSTSDTVPATLVATWRGRDPTRSINLQWLAQQDLSPALVRVDLSRSNATEPDADVWARRRLFGRETGLVLHRAVLTGLQEATRYDIAIDGTATGLTVETAPSRITEPLRFVEGGDIGTSSTVPPLHRVASALDPLFGFVGGDLAYADGVDAGRWVQLLEQWHRYMRSGDRLVPIVAGIGNHEVLGGFGGRPDNAPMYYDFFGWRRREGRAFWTLDVGEDLSIVVLDSNHTAPIAGEQTDWYRRALMERSGRPFLMAAYHVPAYPSVSDVNGPDRGHKAIREHWVPLHEEYQIDVAFEHDDHAYKRTHLLREDSPDPNRGILYLGDGAWGRGPKPVSTPGERPYLAVSRSVRHVIGVTLYPDGRREYRALNEAGAVVDWFVDDRSLRGNRSRH